VKPWRKSLSGGSGRHRQESLARRARPRGRGGGSQGALLQRTIIETLYRGLADNSVGKVIDQILRADLILIGEIGFAPMDDTDAQLFFRLIAAAYEHRALGIGSHWPFEELGSVLARAQHGGQSSGPARPSRHICRHERRVISDEGGPNERNSVLVKEEIIHALGVGTLKWTPAGT
jgi:hypothetical protein